jgi:hypothetical protein
MARTEAHPFRLVCRIEQRSLISLLIQRKTARILTFAAEILAFRRAGHEITAKSLADLGCCLL